MCQSCKNVGFTLIELLIVVGLIALLLAILLPSLGDGQRSAKAASCLNNIRQIGIAHRMYMLNNEGRIIDVGLAHGGVHGDEDSTWIKSLGSYYRSYQNTGHGKEIKARSPLDRSPHWGPNGQPVPGGGGKQFRRTSYGLNDYLTRVAPLPEQRFRRWRLVPNPANTVHVVIMAFEGDFAGSDHVHATGWFRSSGPSAAARASAQVQTNAVSGETGSPDAISNWGFLDGSVKQASFEELGTGPDFNSFNPAVAQ